MPPQSPSTGWVKMTSIDVVLLWGRHKGSFQSHSPGDSEIRLKCFDFYLTPNYELNENILWFCSLITYSFSKYSHNSAVNFNEHNILGYTLSKPPPSLFNIFVHK